MLHDIRYALRTLTRQKSFVAVAVLTLALGIGVNTATFSVVNAVLFRPLAYPDAQRLYVIHELHPAPVLRTRLTAENFLDVQREARAFAAVGGYTGTGFTLSGRGGEPEMVIGQMISAELLDVLGVAPLIGRAFRPDENEGGRNQVMLLGHALWQRRFGADPAIVGQPVIANGQPFTVVGIMPPGFEFPSKRYQLWVPFAFRNNAQGLVNRSARFMQAAGRLRADVSPEQAQAELTAVARRLELAYPNHNANATIRMSSLVDETLGDVRTPLLLLLSAVAFVLLIACANVTNLLLARAATREREVAVRTALGASRLRIVRQLLTETLVLFGAGAGVGILFAAWSLDALIAVSPTDIPRLEQTRLDITTLLFALGSTLATGLVFGVVPALQATSQAAAEHLRASVRSATAGRASGRARAAFVAAEVALSLMLLIGAGLAARTLLQLRGVDTGLRPDGVLTFNVLPPDTQYPTGDSVRRFHRDVLERLAAQPGALAVGATTHLPLSGQNVENGFTPEGWVPPAPNQPAIAGLRGVAGEYFAAIGARLIAGRTFNGTDTAAGQLVALVNEQFARRYWPGQDPVGKRLKLGSADSDDPWRVVIGVYAGIKHMGPEAETRPEVLLPYPQLDDVWATRWMRSLSVVMRTDGDPMSLVSVARGAVRSVDALVPLVEPQPMSRLLSESVAQPRFRSTVFASFAVLAALLAVIGIYGVVAFIVEQRTHEIGVRVALGASRRSVIALVLRQGSAPVAVGMAVGLAGAWIVGRTMQELLFQVEPTDPLTFTAMPVLLAAAALAACVVPARRALAVDPATALRAE